jgi:hypothetical protein
MTISISQEKTAEVKTVIDTGLTDDKGRKIGLLTKEWDDSRIELDTIPQWGIYKNLDGGEYKVLNMQVTRNGLTYGACQGDEYFKTSSDRDAAIAKRLATILKRHK